MVNRGNSLLTGLAVGLLSVSLSQNAMATDSVSTTIHHQYQAPRALGMGDAFVAVANDYSAIFYNPAGLARLEQGQVNLSLGVGATPGAKDFYDEYKAIEGSGKTETDKQTDYLNLIQKHYGDVYSLRLSPVDAVWVRPKWGVALIPMDLSVEMAMHQQVGPTMNTTVYADTTLALSYADDLHWFDYGRFSMGITGKFVNRGFFSKAISAVDLAASSQIVRKEDLIEGYTVDADIGLLWTPEIPDEGFWSVLRLARPTFGAVVRNVAETGFGHSLKLVNKEAQEGTPEKLYRVVDVGTRWEYPAAWIFGGRGVLDVRDMGHPDFSWRKSLHAGLEFDWTVSSWWKGHYRGGFSEGYWTAGLSAELGIFNLDVVSYANDVGSKSTPVESRVYATKLSLDF
ncbi:PorV/PorQ family protein [Bdellovibrio svalbardensis]|uniref:Conjugal transfer protein TraF n=1 Tax=Bdellovibrio svalbardensis TaxID=2972972 RepID=A0ABT6DI36_9BACT|nr:hypothetical protein [Bdellovibrio svalbardensis]MDG0815584.1 hypothetical protein [Bdellovibrio svalbardensis]